MILLLGASGYVGSAFQRAIDRRGDPVLPLARKELDYTRYDALVRVLKERRPTFVINAAGYTGKPNVDGCESARADTLLGNVVFPLTLSHACEATSTPWGHVSSGCIYSGAVVTTPDDKVVERNLTRPAIQELIRNKPEALSGFTEEDEPNFSFRCPPCSFYSGTKALAEELLARDRQVYLWRLRIPFNEIDNPRNYLSKLQSYPKAYDNVNSLSHLDEFVDACLALWTKRAPYGVYNVSNTGYITTRRVIELISNSLKPARTFAFWKDDEEFYRVAANTPRSNCVLDNTKLLSAGIQMRPVEEALGDALSRWVPAG